ncbi:ADP-ribose pyrophosphatase [Streptoalloteichus tenebrarius]|uniref:ADP-ribose pyrophosphatase n=1 Tax=Streptoalloteichus tenebrarius (strain ATCC 17920 / DSM 40477 / JCM 4838 / CBS 697.72 / NBRC 16177 / NCIMB 11028 / NRRL B-12390 / A12253. 1 / ISP 5477) TaxID=1933 RepID=A0ABT1I155_STRSD|nr:NUDIX hydrolase [Streptoalloteichus tenebrarius]MCP2261499.1 ADP-ribose pyrophosphatase [Streptoalloteichus tenebrarius]BFE99343.1 NUDIX hydrolase [Streptoalloteichus tenebrarius]
MRATGPASVEYRNPWFRVRRQTYVDALERRHDYHYVDKADSVLVVPRTEDDRYVMVELERPTFPGYRGTEFPQGGVEDGETVEIAALRELVEETGWVGGGARRLGVVQEAAGFANSSIHVVTVTALRCEVPRSTEEFEANRRPLLVRPGEMNELVATGAVRDAATLAACFLLLAHE